MKEGQPSPQSAAGSRPEDRHYYMVTTTVCSANGTRRHTALKDLARRMEGAV